MNILGLPYSLLINLHIFVMIKHLVYKFPKPIVETFWSKFPRAQSDVFNLLDSLLTFINIKKKQEIVIFHMVEPNN